MSQEIVCINIKVKDTDACLFPGQTSLIKVSAVRFTCRYHDEMYNYLVLVSRLHEGDPVEPQESLISWSLEKQCNPCPCMQEF